MNRVRRRGAADRSASQVRVPPHSIEAEQAVLGGLMLVPEALDRVIELVDEGDFYRRDHQLIYRAIRELDEKSKPFDAVTLSEWFDSLGLSEQVAGGSYLIELASTTPSAANIDAYAAIVRDKSILRRLIEAGSNVVSLGFDPQGREASDVVAEAQQMVDGLAETGLGKQRLYVTAREGMRQVFDTLHERYEAKSGIIGLATGYVDLDRLTAGLQPTDVIVVAGRPSMGKTTLALNIAEYVAVSGQGAVALFSMEMSADQLYLRLLASVSRVAFDRLRTGLLEDEDWPRITAAITKLKDCPILVDESGGLTPETLRARARRMKREHDIKLVVVDYLQLMRVADQGENRANEVGEISRSLKALAKELRVPVIAISQLNRALETRTEKRPVMADLRESGSIEQDADVVCFVYRDEYYNKNSPDKGLAEVIIGKQRQGSTGTVKLRFFGEFARFENLSRDSYGAIE